MARFCGQEDAQRCRAISERRCDRFEAELRDLIERKRQDIRGQTIPVPSQRIDQRATMALVMKQQNRRVPAGVAIDAQHRAHSPHEGVGGRHA